MERVAAGAGAGGVGVVDREALLLDGVDEVDLGTVEVGDAHPVHDHGHAVEVGGHVAVEGALVEEELVAKARAATGLHGDTQRQVVTTLLLEEAVDLAGGDCRKVDLVGAALSGLDLLGHLITPEVSGTACLNGRTPRVIPRGRGIRVARRPRWRHMAGSGADRGPSAATFRLRSRMVAAHRANDGRSWAICRHPQAVRRRGGATGIRARKAILPAGVNSECRRSWCHARTRAGSWSRPSDRSASSRIVTARRMTSPPV